MKISEKKRAAVLKREKIMKKIIFSAFILLTAAGCTVSLPEDELSVTRGKMEHYMLNEVKTQSEMNLVSSYMVQLANMEKYLIEYRIWNQANYDYIEKEFQADCEAWEKRAEAENQKPSQYKGGSLAPMDHNLRMTDFIEKRIHELRIKWRKK